MQNVAERIQKYVTTIYLVSAIEVHIGFEAITDIVMRLLAVAGPPLSTACALYARPSKDHNYYQHGGGETFLSSMLLTV